MQTKKCSKCKQELTINNFHKNKNKKNGLGSHCKSCRSNDMKQYYQNNKEHRTKYNKQYYQDNKDSLMEEQRQRSQQYKLLPPITNGVKTCVHCGVKQDINKFGIDNYTKDGRRSQCKKCHNQYKRQPIIQQRRNEQTKERRKIDPVYALRKNISSHLRYSLNNINSSKHNMSTLNLLQISIIDLNKLYQKYINNLCIKCQQTILVDNPRNYQLDHILPISLAKTKEEVIYLNQLNNLRLICVNCNQEKRDRIEHPELLEKFEKWQYEQQELLYELVNF